MTLTTRQKERIDEMIYEAENRAKRQQTMDKMLPAKMYEEGMRVLSCALGYTPFTVHEGREWLRRKHS